MQAVSGERLLVALDRAHGQHYLQCALTALALGMADVDLGDVEELPLFERDRLLLEMRALSFGPTLEATALCPACGATLEFTTSTAAVIRDLESQREQRSFEWTEDGTQLCLRAATTRDLFRSLDAGSIDAAEDAVLMGCLRVGEKPADETALRRWPSVRAHFERMHAATLVSFRLACSQCGDQFTLDFDVPRFVWLEIRHAARRLLSDVHVLASHYGWNEREIVTMSPQRRAAYLEMLSA